MTQEEKAKAYDEVVARINKAVSDGLVSENFGRDMLGIAESEDERIRKFLIRLTMAASPKAVEKENLDKKQILSWLEKQKEQKPGTTEDNPISPFDTKLFQDGVKEGRRLEREDILKEQKPAEWSEEDEKMLTSIMERGSSQVPFGEPALREEQMEWLMNLLKSLRPQPKQKDRYQEGFQDGVYEGRRRAWEEYNKIFAYRYEDFNYKLPCYEGGPCTNPHFDCFNCPRKDNNSVKTYTSPNTTEYQSWKPSEEQMVEALVARDIDGSLTLYINPEHKMELPSEMFPELTWGGKKNLTKVELIIRPL